MAGEPERAGGSADAALPGRPPLCLARNCLTVRQFGPLESIDPNDAMILPHGANLDRMKFSERTGGRPINKVKAAPEGSPWFWTLAYGYHYDCTPIHGYEATREAAMAAFAKSWRRE
jgi:hypothetical protein